MNLHEALDPKSAAQSAASFSSSEWWDSLEKFRGSGFVFYCLVAITDPPHMQVPYSLILEELLEQALEEKGARATRGLKLNCGLWNKRWSLLFCWMLRQRSLMNKSEIRSNVRPLTGPGGRGKPSASGPLIIILAFTSASSVVRLIRLWPRLCSQDIVLRF